MSRSFNSLRNIVLLRYLSLRSHLFDYDCSLNNHSIFAGACRRKSHWLNVCATLKSRDSAPETFQSVSLQSGLDSLYYLLFNKLSHLFLCVCVCLMLKGDIVFRSSIMRSLYNKKICLIIFQSPRQLLNYTLHFDNLQIHMSLSCYGI